MGEQKSAEAVVVARNRSDEVLNLPCEWTVGCDLCWSVKQKLCVAGGDQEEVGAGSFEGQYGRLDTAGDTSPEPSSLTLFISSVGRPMGLKDTVW